MMRRLSLLLAILVAGSAHAAGASQSAYDAVIAETKSAMMEDPGRALLLARKAELVAVGLPAGTDALDIARSEWLQGEALARLEQPDRAIPVLEKALASVDRLAPSDRLHGDILLSRGWVQGRKGGIAAALADFQQAYLLYRDAREKRGQAKALQNIAGIYQDAGDNPHALRYYQQAAEAYRGDPAFDIAGYNNIGELLRKLGRYQQAEHQFELALKAAQAIESPRLQANILTNLASTHLLRRDSAGADRLARQALALSTAREAAEERPFVWGVLAQIAWARGNVAQAAGLIGQTFAGVDLQTSPLPYRDFHKLAAEIYARQGRGDLALAHLRAWKRLDDNVREVAASTNAALMGAQFDFSNQNLRIAQLQANRARLAVAAITLISALLLIGILSLRRSRNQTRAANRQLTKALQAKSDFLAMTSHEIRTPLNGILGMTQVILADRQIAGPLRTKIEVVHGAGETMRALVDDILDLSKMETGNLSIQRAPVRLRHLLTEAANLWRGKAETKGLSLSLDLSECPVLVEEDEDRLRQILFNLLSNAVKFTEAGSVTVRARSDQERLVIAIIDTGIGVAPEHHELIFEKFQQADQSTSRRFGGTGLGLAICRNLAEALDGDITIESRLDEGATFTLSLPLRILDAGETEVAPGGEDRSVPVLLLEPNQLTQRILSRTLQEAIGPVAAVAGPAELIDALSSGRHSHALVQAAAASEHLQEIAALAQSQAVRLVLLAAADQAIDEASLANSGAVLLRKPVVGDAVVAALLNETQRRPKELVTAA